MKFKLVWLFLNMLVLGWLIKPGEVPDLFSFAFALALLSFPSGAVVFATWWIGSIYFEGYLAYEPVVAIWEYLIIWAVCSALGYWQWVKFLPRFSTEPAQT